MLNHKSKTRLIYLSYPLQEGTPAYGGAQGSFIITPEKSMEKGDSCNTARWEISNHLGTHLDFPRHFVRSGMTIDDYPINYFRFQRIGFLSLPAPSGGRLISSQDLSSADLPEDTDFLIIKTGFCYKREEALYWKQNPGFSPDVADYLRDSFPQLRVLGFDSISLSSLMHRDLGRKAHKRFLDHQRPILVLEDMDLTQIGENSQLVQLIVAPFRVAGADATPCTVLAEVKE